MTTSGGTGARTTAKSLHLVEELHRRDGARITDLAADLDMSKSTVHNHLSTLRQCGYVIKDGNDYRLGLKFLQLGGRVRSRMDLYRCARPAVEKLVAETHEEVLLATEELGEGVVLIHFGPSSRNHGRRTGHRFPLLGTPEGEVILAHLPETRIHEILKDADGVEDGIVAHLAALRERGYATSKASYRGEIRRVATAIRAEGEDVVGSLCLVEGRDVDLDHSKEDTVEMVTTVADQIERNLEQQWYGSESVITPKHSLSAYSPRTSFDSAEDPN